MNITCNNRDITLTTGSLSWTNTINELATKATFEIPKVNGQFTSIYHPKIGDPVGIDMGELGRVFQGDIIIIDDGSKEKNSYTAVDWGFYLNKEEITIQFNNIPIEDSIRQVIGGKIDVIIGVSGSFSGEFIDKKKSEVLDELLKAAQEQTGYVFNYDVTPKGLRVYRLGALHADPKFTLSPNKTWAGTQHIPSLDFRGDEQHSISVEDGHKEAYSFTILDDEDNYIRAGEEIKVDDARYIIHSAEHSIENGWHKVKLGVENAG